MGTDRDRIDAYLPLRPVEFHILLSLAAGERHGYGIIQDIEARGDSAVPDVGTMYRALARMVESGLIEQPRRGVWLRILITDRQGEIAFDKRFERLWREIL